MKYLIKFMLSVVAVLVAAYLLAPVHIEGGPAAIVLVIVLGILNLIVKPILIILTIPLTILTLGLFLLVINTVIIMMADALMTGFNVDGFLWALIYSVFLSIFNYLIETYYK